jgi:hypothetical protein
MVERSFGNISDEEMLDAAMRSDRVRNERFPEITWEHSHVCVDPDGAIITYCVYSAPSEQMIRDHADGFGGHTITHLYEIADDVTPSDLQKRAAS